MPTISERTPLLLDTHIWLWLEAGSSELSMGDRDVISARLGAGLLRIAAISLWELALLASRGRVSLGKPTDLWLQEALVQPAPTVEPLNAAVAVASCELPGTFHRDPADRIIVATARVIGATLMTRDRRILDYAAAGHVMALSG